MIVHWAQTTPAPRLGLAGRGRPRIENSVYSISLQLHISTDPKALMTAFTFQKIEPKTEGELHAIAVSQGYNAEDLEEHDHDALAELISRVRHISSWVSSAPKGHFAEHALFRSPRPEREREWWSENGVFSNDGWGWGEGSGRGD